VGDASGAEVPGINVNLSGANHLSQAAISDAGGAFIFGAPATHDTDYGDKRGRAH